MQLAELVAAMEQIAPTRYAEPWDNVGLLVGDPLQEVGKAILTIDLTPAVADEAEREGCDVVLAYHPPIFQPINRIMPDSPVYRVIRRGMAVYSPHTAWDVAEGGANDLLADAIGLTDRRPLRLSAVRSSHHKLVVFAPERDVERLSAVLSSAGAGVIGNYTSCSFRTRGTGTFLGGEGTSPAVGQRGRLETVEEVRLEMLVPIGRTEAVIGALRANHPYEEPAFDLLQLAPAPEGKGIGRIGTVGGGVTREQLYGRLKQELGIGHILAAGPPRATVHRAAVCAGACGDLLDDAIAQGADFLVTGEMRHHEAMRAVRAGMTVVCTLHSNSERASLNRLGRRLTELLPALSVHLSGEDRDPFELR